MIRNQMKSAIIMTIVLTVLTGFIYPVVVWGIAQIIFPSQANGSLVMRDGRPVGSRLIGQNFSQDKLFSSAAVGRRRQRLRRVEFERLESRPHQQGLDRGGARARVRRIQRGRSDFGRRCSGRSGDGVG